MMKQLERIAVLIAVVLFCGTLVVGYERSGDAPTPVARRSPAPHAIQPSPSQMRDADSATETADQPPAPVASGRHPRPEEIVRLPRQIQDQVARTVLTPPPMVGDGEILSLPWQIQDQVRQVQLTPTN